MRIAPVRPAERGEHNGVPKAELQPGMGRFDFRRNSNLFVGTSDEQATI